MNMEGGNAYGVSRAGGKKKGSSRRKRISGGLFLGTGGGEMSLGGSPYGMAGGTGHESNTFSMVGGTGHGMPTGMPTGIQGQISALLKEGIVMPSMSKTGGGHSRRLRRRTGKARHHRTKSYTAGGKKGRKTRRRHRRRH